MNKSTGAIKTFFLAVLLATANISCAQNKTEKLDALISTYVKYGKFNGSVLVAENGEVIYKKGFGMANVEWEIPNQPNTKFRLASVTKQFTAMLIVQLAAENKLKLDVPITTYLPDYPAKTGSRVTIHHLLTHTSGIPDYTSFPIFREMMRDAYKPEEMVKLFADSALQFTPGERFQYSNSGYILLGVIIEKLTGKTFEQVLQSKILTPLKMNNTGIDHNDVVLKNRASGYNRIGSTFQNAAFIDMSVPYAAGAMYSTVEDLYLWDKALYTEMLLPKKYMDLIFEKHIPAGVPHYGYGWEVGEMPVGSTEDGIESTSHGGGINGFATRITRIPTDKTLIVLLNNTSGAPLFDMTAAVIGILKNKPYDFPKKAIATSLLEVIEKDGIVKALLHYKAIKDSADYYLNENEMNTAGYQLLQSGKTKEAVAIFKLNVEAYPKAFNPYDSYGEALLALGDTAGAIVNYSRSVKLNPGNVYGTKVLKQLGVNTDTLIKKVPVEELKLLEGEYLVTNPASDGDKYWKIVFKVENGELTGNDRGYRYKLVPMGDNKFINPDDGASLDFDTKDKSAITLTLFGKFKFRKVI